MKDIEKALTEGLLAGYAGGETLKVVRAGFEGTASDVPVEGGRYHDEWFVTSHIGGGQELVEVSGQKFTRLYAGGTPGKEVLERLGITADEVGEFLKRNIKELGGRTRLYEDCVPAPEGEWQYSYKLTSNDAAIGVATGTETINYKDTTVHIHAFILSLVK